MESCARCPSCIRISAARPPIRLRRVPPRLSWHRALWKVLSGTRLWIDYSVDWSKFHRIAWKDASNVLARSPEAFRDRVILVGGEFAGSGDVYSAVPSASALPREMSGLVLQALTLNTLLEGRRIETPNETLLVAFLAVVLGAAVMALLSHTGSGWTMGTLAVTRHPLHCVFVFALPMESSALADRRTGSGIRTRDHMCHPPAPQATAFPKCCDRGEWYMTRGFGVVVISFVLQLSSGLCKAPVAAMLEEPVAIVCFLSGKAFTEFENNRSELRLFQRLRPGTFIETETGSKVVLTFFTGDRYEFGEEASGTVGHKGLDDEKGAIQKLTPVPAMIDIAPIARNENPGTRSAAIRIRKDDAARKSISILYPSAGAATVRRPRCYVSIL